MISELNELANDPNFVLEFAVGDPFPELIRQNRASGIKVSGIYFDEPKRYILKKAHLSREDHRIFDVDTGKLVMVSHHPGKNPYESFDPLGANDDKKHRVFGGEWECLCQVTGQGQFPSVRIRPKTLSRHGRQYVMMGDKTIMNVGKMGKLKTMSLRPHFAVGKGDDKDPVWIFVADMLGRTIAIRNEKDELVAQVTKTTKALIQNAVFGSGSESTVDIAPGVDCGAILAAVYGIGQVGEHYVKDAFSNFVMEPAQDAAIDAATEATGTEEYVGKYNKLSVSMAKKASSLQKQAELIVKFFQ